MKPEFLIIHQKLIPETYLKVIEAREMVQTRQVKDISEACKRLKLSRSTYYKYKDLVFRPDENKMTRKAILSLLLDHQQGVLSEVLGFIARTNANVLTLTQNTPIRNIASVILMLDILDMRVSLDQLLDDLKHCKGVNTIQLLDLE
jgi:chorismate mutase